MLEGLKSATRFTMNNVPLVVFSVVVAGTLYYLYEAEDVNTTCFNLLCDVLHRYQPAQFSTEQGRDTFRSDTGVTVHHFFGHTRAQDQGGKANWHLGVSCLGAEQSVEVDCKSDSSQAFGPGSPNCCKLR